MARIKLQRGTVEDTARTWEKSGGELAIYILDKTYALQLTMRAVLGEEVAQNLILVCDQFLKRLKAEAPHTKCLLCENEVLAVGPEIIVLAVPMAQDDDGAFNCSSSAVCKECSRHEPEALKAKICAVYKK